MKSIDERAHLEALVRHWFETDEDLEAVYVARAQPVGEGRPTFLLLQVTRATPVSHDEVALFGFAPSNDFPFPIATGQVRPEEVAAIRHGSLKLPWEWHFEQTEEIPRSRLVA